MTQAYNKPIPVPQGESDFYWQKAKEHELWLRCDNDHPDGPKAYFYPRDISPYTFSRNTSWIKASGNATLFTYAIVHRAPHPGWYPGRSAFRHGDCGVGRGSNDADQHRHG